MTDLPSSAIPSGGSAIKQTEGAFTRKASGLVRAFSPLDALLYNTIAINPFVTAALTFTLMVAAFPGASPWLAVLIVGVFCCAEAVVYALLIATMPRSGGDYVFQTRILNGGTGAFVVFAGIVLTQLVSVMILATIGGGLIMAPFLTVLGAQLHAHGLVSAGTWFGGKWGTLTVAIVITLFAVGLNVYGLKVYARVQRFIFWPAMILLLTVLVIMLASGTSTFRSNFDAFMASKFHVQHAYATVLARSSAPTAFSLKATILALPLAAYAMIFPAWSAFQAGEVREARSVRKNLFTVAGAEIICTLLSAAAAALLVSLVGTHFFTAAADLNFNNPAKYPLPVPPYFSFFATFAAGSVFMSILLFLTGFLWFWMITPNVPLGVSRVLMAMSLDRVLPERFGRVSSRYHTPIFSLLVCLAVILLACIAYLITPNVLQFTSSFILMSIVTFTVTMIAGILLPLRRKDLAEGAPPEVRRRWLGIPIIAFPAVIFIVFSVFVIIESLTRGAYGVNTTKGLAAIGTYFGISLIVYLAAKYYRRNVDHFDLSLSHRQLPVE
jgi:amino acid transporter